MARPRAQHVQHSASTEQVTRKPLSFGGSGNLVRSSMEAVRSHSRGCPVALRHIFGGSPSALCGAALQARAPEKLSWNSLDALWGLSESSPTTLW
eukprot:9293469-Alexandrium_andersonii.AAC.1